MPFIKYKIADNAYAQLAAAVGTTAASIAIKNAQNLPDGGNWVATLAQYGDDGFVKKHEKVLVKNNLAGVLTVERGFGGNPVLEFNESDYIFLNIVTEIIEDIQDELERIGMQIGALAEKNTIFGPDGKFLPEKMPDIAINNTFTAENQAAMLKLKAEVGDMCIRTDQNSMMYVLAGTDPKVLANWKKISVDLSQYYNKDEVNVLLGGKASSNHNHDNIYASKTHNHNGVYAPVNHEHAEYAKKAHINFDSTVTGANNGKARIIQGDRPEGSIVFQFGKENSRFSIIDANWTKEIFSIEPNGQLIINNNNITNEWQDFTPKPVGGSGGEGSDIRGKFRYKIIGKTCFCEWNFGFLRNTLAGRPRIALPVGSRNGGEIYVNAMLGGIGTKPTTQIGYPVLQGGVLEWLSAIGQAGSWGSYSNTERIYTSGSISYEIS